MLRHSSAHLLAEAVRRLYPGVKVAIGPPIENGFYYDFEFPEPIGEADLERIEAEVERELAEGREWSREVVTRRRGPRAVPAEGEPYKVELVDAAEGPIGLYTQSYTQGEFADLCRGPHLQDSGPIKAFKLTGLAGAYWRGDEHNTQLTRIYGTAFYSQGDLDAYLERLEEAKRRDHRRLGTQLDLFHFSELSPGSPFWHPKGMAIWNVLEDLRRHENAARGYVEVRRRPSSTTRSSGSPRGTGRSTASTCSRSTRENHEFGLKPMNCPGHCVLYADGPGSYRELPLRFAEAGVLHRDELAGALHGSCGCACSRRTTRTSSARPSRPRTRCSPAWSSGMRSTTGFGLEIEVELSTRPENKLGSDEEWDAAEAALARVLDRRGLEDNENAGDGFSMARRSTCTCSTRSVAPGRSEPSSSTSKQYVTGRA